MQLEDIIAKELAGIINERFTAAFAPMKADIDDLKAQIKILESKKPEKGEPGPQGPQGLPGKDGVNGIDGKDGAGPSRGRHRGPWKADEEYHIDDSVTSGGSGWIAIVENAKDRPGDSKDWLLFVKKGRDGKDGEKGIQGPAGPAGKDHA